MIEVGKVYEVNHKRKGQFALRVTIVSGDWITGVIHRGPLNAPLKAGVGTTAVIQESLATWKEVTPEGIVVNSSQVPSQQYTLAELRALRQRWDEESKGGIDPYEVDKFLDWMEAQSRNG